MSAITRILTAVAGACAALFAGSGTSHAEFDDAVSLVDGLGRTLTVQQWDTFLDGVSPLDRNRLTREWFHSGRAAYLVIGDGAHEFTGTLELGYQVGFPWALGTAVDFAYSSPNITFGGWGIDDNLADRIYTPPLIPAVSISVDLGNGPGVLEAATISVEVGGPGGIVAISNAHGAITGAAGGVVLRPFARLVSSAGDSLTTYGKAWTMS
ncbi:MspA family porin [Mycolicibacterium poriferae]|uniref:MspA family porin n=1 Tax=Mycolicibacterium poriferae TaxID=39694 RepID=UPI0024BB61F9|nr:MspA family porin [Mycolicibacterium poriferae]